MAIKYRSDKVVVLNEELSISAKRGSAQSKRRCPSCNRPILTLSKLLGAHLQEADPMIYEILQKVGPKSVIISNLNLSDQWPGKTTAEAFHKSHTLGEFHISGCP